MDTRAYYDSHLGRFYSWMAGDFDTKQQEFYDFLSSNKIMPAGNGLAYDLGTAHGIQAVALAKAGFRVTAVDFNEQLLAELAANAAGLDIEIIKADIRTARKELLRPAEVVVCWGDTLTHLDSLSEARNFVGDMPAMLAPSGTLLLSFRDYTRELVGPERFIHVKSDNTRILTCFLEYEPEQVVVTDLFNERVGEAWKLTAMSYKKVRIDPRALVDVLREVGLTITNNHSVKGMVVIIASKS